MNNKHWGFWFINSFIFFFHRLYNINIQYLQQYSDTWSGNDPSEPSRPLFTNIYNIWG